MAPVQFKHGTVPKSVYFISYLNSPLNFLLFQTGIDRNVFFSYFLCGSFAENHRIGLVSAQELVSSKRVEYHGLHSRRYWFYYDIHIK